MKLGIGILLALSVAALAAAGCAKEEKAPQIQQTATPQPAPQG